MEKLEWYESNRSLLRRRESVDASIENGECCRDGSEKIDGIIEGDADRR